MATEEEVKELLLSTYRDGFHDGIEEMIAQLLDESKVEGTLPYKGPMPDELHIWLGKLKESL